MLDLRMTSIQPRSPLWSMQPTRLARRAGTSFQCFITGDLWQIIKEENSVTRLRPLRINY